MLGRRGSHVRLRVGAVGTILRTMRKREHDTALSREFQPLLTELGRRVRAVREARALSLAELARGADVSRRYLTELESGRANPSIEVLARLARQLGEPLARLLDLPLAGRRSERIALIGLRGAGKTTLGRLLARELEVPFVELDQRVERLAGLSLAEIFSLHGEPGFQRYEREALEAVLAEGERSVIALSGSIVAHAANWERVRAACRTIWLRARPEEHLARVAAQGDTRPMRNRPRALDELRALLAVREPGYAQCEIALDTSARAPGELARELARRIAPAD
ncbi:MAG: helix-turn-helix domain-containing protein [Planctomycetota bacterium]|nr:MAG: helix-turn-helix domain-containing protein [Planctomycetota bacterium]